MNDIWTHANLACFGGGGSTEESSARSFSAARFDFVTFGAVGSLWKGQGELFVRSQCSRTISLTYHHSYSLSEPSTSDVFDFL